MMTQKQVRVSPKIDGGWRVHQPSHMRDSVHTQTKVEAIQKATQIAKRIGGDTKIQNKNGKISGGNSYGRDPFPPRDKR